MDFTIVTASYNYAHYIAECLESVASQEGVTFEHLVMDGCSTDNTSDVVSKFPHVCFYQEPDKGMSDAINKGFRLAKGKWVMWLNADDRLQPGALKIIKDYAQLHPRADVIYGCWNYVNASGYFIRKMTLFPFDKQILIQHGCYIGSTACFYRRQTTIDEGYLLDDDFGYSMDAEYYVRMAHHGKRFIYIPRILADFRLHSESISQKSIGKEDMKNVLRMQRQAAEPRAIRRIYGIKPFRDENLSLIVDGIFYHIYRFKKGMLKFLYSKNVF